MWLLVFLGGFGVLVLGGIALIHQLVTNPGHLPISVWATVAVTVAWLVMRMAAPTRGAPVPPSSLRGRIIYASTETKPSGIGRALMSLAFAALAVCMVSVVGGLDAAASYTWNCFLVLACASILLDFVRNIVRGPRELK